MNETKQPAREPARRRLPALLRNVVLAGAIAGSLSACVPLIIGGVVGAGLLVTDRRTTGAQMEDEGIELRGSSCIREAIGNRGRVSLTSYNRIVLLTGQVDSSATRQQAEAIARALPNARTIANEITVGPFVVSSGNDALISSRVKTALVGASNVRSNAVKVTTENGVVYLMGIVTQAESDRAADVASTVEGVVKVVKVFEVISETAFSGNLPPQSAPAGTAAPATPVPAPASRTATTP